MNSTATSPTAMSGNTGLVVTPSRSVHTWAASMPAASWSSSARAGICRLLPTHGLHHVDEVGETEDHAGLNGPGGVGLGLELREARRGDDVVLLGQAVGNRPEHQRLQGAGPDLGPGDRDALGGGILRAEVAELLGRVLDVVEADRGVADLGGDAGADALVGDAAAGDQASGDNSDDRSGEAGAANASHCGSLLGSAGGSITLSMTPRAHSSRAIPVSGRPVAPGVPGRGTRIVSTGALTIDLG